MAATLGRLLHADPQQRFSSMAEAVQELRGIDDLATAFARYAYDLACRQPGFFDAFYKAFFTACPDGEQVFRKVHGGQHAERMEKQATALRYALMSALASGNALKKNVAHLRPQHSERPRQYFTAFAETFVTTLRVRVPESPSFVLDACASVLKRAAEAIAS